VDRGWQIEDPEAQPRFDYDGNPNRDGLKPVQELHRRGLLTTRVTAMLDPRGGGYDGVKMTGYHSIGMIGDDVLRIGGIGPGFFMKQVAFGNTATMLPPAKEYERSVHFLACNRWNWTDQTYLEATIRFKLDVIERVNRTCPIEGLRLTFEGVQEPLSQASLARIKALGMGVTTFATNIQGRTPLPDLQGPTPFADLERAGVRWCMSSDGTLGNPSQPFGHLWYAVTGQTMDPNGRVQPENQRISRLAALRAKTSNCKFHLQNEAIGTLRPGDYADLIVLSADYFNAPGPEIRFIRSVLTVMNGQVVHGEGAFAALDDGFAAKRAAFKQSASFPN
jgi:predicted amidohydrolase YtcJ